MNDALRRARTGLAAASVLAILVGLSVLAPAVAPWSRSADEYSVGPRVVRPDPVSFFDELAQGQSQAPPLFVPSTSATALALRPLDGLEVLYDGVRVPRLDEDWAHGGSGAIESIRDNKHLPTVEGHMEGKIDAGGPYGGPATFEGDVIAFTATPLDPSIIFYRWDLNNDSVFDVPDQTGGGPFGRWTTVPTFTKTILDDADGDVVVEGWDGASQKTEVENGTSLNEREDWSVILTAAGFNVGWQFKVKKEMDVLQLGHYHHDADVFDQALWSTSGVLLGSCSPPQVPWEWNWCNLPGAVHLNQGESYRLSIRLTSTMMGLDRPTETEKVEFGSMYYCYNPTSVCFPMQLWTDVFIPALDFRWRTVQVLPDSARDTAPIEVHNVEPTLRGFSYDPSPVPEGGRGNLTVRFDDPGLDDTWDVRWALPDGRSSGWREVRKIMGGGTVLILHSWTGDIGTIQDAVVNACGGFCLAVDEFDFGPLGQNRVPSLDELTAYDVLVVGTNWGPIPNSNAMGDRIAEFMDAAGGTGGGVIPLNFASHNSDVWGIGRRWASEKSPFPRVGPAFGTSTLGTIYVPGHPLLAGVSDVTAFFRLKVEQPMPGATRIADYVDGLVFAAEKMDGGGRIACGLNYFPSITIGGDYARVIANAIRYCSRQPDPVPQTMPFVVNLSTPGFPDDDPATGTPVDPFPIRLEVRDDDGGLVGEDATIDVRNVDPQVVGGFDNAQRDASGNVTFKGFRIADPALWERTEWFAYAWDFGDGTPIRWEYKGNMVPPKFDVLLLHTLCLSGNACTFYAQLRDVLLSLDDVASLDGYNFMNYPGLPQAPDLGLLTSHDVVVVVMNWGYLSFPPWNLVRRQVGDRLAEYLDADVGGVVTLLTALDLAPRSGDHLSLSGRYVEDDYGPFEKATIVTGAVFLESLLNPDHDMFVRVSPGGVQSSIMHSGDYQLTAGGNNQAAGRNGDLLARWSDGNSAIGVKELNNGRRTVHIGLFGAIVGSDTSMLLRNAIGWAAGGIPSPILPTTTHTFGNSPPYTVDLMVIDDDMGWAWDPVLGVPVEVIPPAVISHRYITIT